VESSLAQANLSPEDPFFLEELRLWVWQRYDWETASRVRQQFRSLETSYLVRRTSLLKKLKGLLLQADDGPQIVALWGTAGMGKTTILRMLWADEEIQARFAFPLWAELGAHGDESLDADQAEARAYDQLSRWANGLSLSTTNLSTVNDLSQALQTHLRARQALILLDDAWTGDSIQPFLIAGSRGRVVITTRNRTLWDDLSVQAKVVEIPPLTPAEARALVEQGTGQDIPPDDPHFQALYERAGGCPLALGLALSGIDKANWAGVVEALSKDEGGLALFERGEGRSRHDSLRASLGLSYDRLQPEKRALVRALGVFPPAPFTAQAVLAVWPQKPAGEITLELEQMCQLSLVQAQSGPGGEARFWLSPLWRRFAWDLLRQKDELAGCLQRYVTYQTSQAEALHEQLHSASGEVSRVMQAVCAQLPHLDQAFRYVCASGDIDNLRRLLTSCPSLFKQAGQLDLWDAWLTVLSPWPAEDSSIVSQDEFLFVEWHLQYADLLLEWRDAETAAEILKEIRTRRLQHPDQRVRRPLSLASMALQFGNYSSAHYHLQRVQKLGYERSLRTRVLSLQAQIARRHRIPSFIIQCHEETIASCKGDQDPLNELAERLHLAESFCQFGWVGKALTELAYVAAVAEEFELPALRLASLTRLVELYLDIGQSRKAAESIARLAPFCDAQTLSRLEFRQQNTPQLTHNLLGQRHHELAQRIAVVGTSGAGKTTLARRLAQCLGYPHLELDGLYWTSAWTPMPTADFRESTRQALCTDCWIADGNHSEVRDIVWGRADLLIWLNYSPPRLVGHRLRQAWQQIGRRGDMTNKAPKTWGQILLGPSSALVWAPRAYYRKAQDYPLSDTISRDQRPLPSLVHLPSPQHAEDWLLRFVESRRRRLDMEHL
jgi:tRNA A37 threonylcarbamoyladenosine biosynthesis protein TsaE